MSVQILPRRIGPPPKGKSLQYYQGWRETLTEWWKYHKPKRGKFRHKTEYDCRHVGKKRLPIR